MQSAEISASLGRVRYCLEYKTSFSWKLERGKAFLKKLFLGVVLLEFSLHPKGNQEIKCSGEEYDTGACRRTIIKRNDFPLPACSHSARVTWHTETKYLFCSLKTYSTCSFFFTFYRWHVLIQVHIKAEISIIKVFIVIFLPWKLQRQFALLNSISVPEPCHRNCANGCLVLRGTLWQVKLHRSVTQSCLAWVVMRWWLQEQD